MELLFYNDESIFYDKDGKLKEEPEESLDMLLEEYRNIDYSGFKKKELEAAGKYTVTRWIGDTEPVFLEDDRRNYASRTSKNARWSDITLALTADIESPGEKTTRKAAGDKFVGYILPDGFRDLEYYPNPVMKMAKEIAWLIEANPNFRKEGLRLNIAGNAMPILSRHGITVNMVSSLIWHILVELAEDGTKIEEVRSGGQTGVDEAAVIAAQNCGLKCSILAPKGFRMHYEDGVEIEDEKHFKDRFRRQVIDYDRWSSESGDDALDLGLAEFNFGEGIEMLEYDIDLKIMHLNKKKGK